MFFRSLFLFLIREVSSFGGDKRILDSASILRVTCPTNKTIYLYLSLPHMSLLDKPPITTEPWINPLEAAAAWFFSSSLPSLFTYFCEICDWLKWLHSKYFFSQLNLMLGSCNIAIWRELKSGNNFQVSFVHNFGL